jgi:ABC-type polysaccharide/polyol phosphate transport system ATPase subunit
MSKIVVDSISLKFRAYHEGATSAKEHFASLFRNVGRQRYSEFWALQDVSFSLGPGERVGIIGPNGAGKSTLLKTICRIFEPSKGRISVDGRVAPILELGAGFHPEFTGRENIYFNGTILGYRKDHIRAIEHEVIRFAELEDFIDTPVKYYSTGMYIRLAFSLATTLDPDILVLDELFAGGDASFVKRGKERMTNMINRANVMILVSHEQSLLQSLCERFIWIDHGKVVADGDARVLAQYANGLPEQARDR